MRPYIMFAVLSNIIYLHGAADDVVSETIQINVDDLIAADGDLAKYVRAFAQSDDEGMHFRTGGYRGDPLSYIWLLVANNAETAECVHSQLSHKNTNWSDIIHELCASQAQGIDEDGALEIAAIVVRLQGIKRSAQQVLFDGKKLSCIPCRGYTFFGIINQTFSDGSTSAQRARVLRAISVEAPIRQNDFAGAAERFFAVSKKIGRRDPLGVLIIDPLIINFNRSERAPLPDKSCSLL